MRPFRFIEPKSLADAVILLTEGNGEAKLIAGGTDLLNEIKDGLIAPADVISLSGLPGIGEISVTESGLNIGAMATISAIASNPQISEKYQALAQAAAGLATPQVRNVGTLGGNLNQRPRCWYYRNPLTHCLKKGGDRCFALAGNSKYLWITGGDRCFIVHPSDTAVALTAFNATVDLVGPGGSRTLPLEDFFIGPDQNLFRENVLGAGEIVIAIHIPSPPHTVEDGSPLHCRSCYLKAEERESGDFALASVAACLTLSGPDSPFDPAASIQHAGIILGGVSPVPYRAREVEEYLQGRPVTEVDPSYAAGLALPSARPMAGNGYKVTLARNLVKRAISQILAVPQ